MSFSEVDRDLLQRCIDRQPQSWQNFVDRFLGLVVHVANHTAKSQNRVLDASTRDDLVGEVFLKLIENDHAILRRFRQHCSLATYLTVIARRVIIRRMPKLQPSANSLGGTDPPMNGSAHERWVASDEVEHLLSQLDPSEAEIVRMYHLQGKSYAEIGRAVGLAENSIGPMLSRAKAKMRG